MIQEVLTSLSFLVIVGATCYIYLEGLREHRAMQNEVDMYNEMARNARNSFISGNAFNARNNNPQPSSDESSSDES